MLFTRRVSWPHCSKMHLKERCQKGTLKNGLFSFEFFVFFAFLHYVEIAFAFRTFNFRRLAAREFPFTLTLHSYSWTFEMIQATPMLSTKTLKENRHSS